VCIRGGGIDKELSTVSKQPVENKVITEALKYKTDTGHKHKKADITDFPSELPASDVYDWAKQPDKPAYSWSEIGNKPSTFPPSSHNHSYLPLSGGTVNGMVCHEQGMTVHTTHNTNSSEYAAGYRFGKIADIKIQASYIGSATIIMDFRWSFKKHPMRLYILFDHGALNSDVGLLWFKVIDYFYADAGLTQYNLYHNKIIPVCLLGENEKAICLKKTGTNLWSLYMTTGYQWANILIDNLFLQTDVGNAPVAITWYNSAFNINANDFVESNTCKIIYTGEKNPTHEKGIASGYFNPGVAKGDEYY